MRVPNITTYSNSTYQLGNLTSRLRDANEVVTTQKRINSISDDPVGVSQVLNLKTTLGNLEQINKNVQVGISWLDGVENTFDSVNSLILNVKSQVSRLSSASSGSDERKDAVESINGMIEQIVTLGNTQISGSYIFAGTDTEGAPFVYHRDEDPPRVSYEGNNDPFKIKTDNNLTVQVGRDGQEAFWDNSVEINSTNNTIVFKEDNGHGSASEKVLTATIPDGEYSAKELGTMVGNLLNEASETNGYGVTYEVSYDEKDKRFSIRDDGTYDGYLRTQFLWDTGGDAHVSSIQASSQTDPDDINLSVLNKEALSLGTPEPLGSKPFKLTWDGKGDWHVDNNPGYIMPSKISGSADGVDLDLDEDGFTDISLKFDKPVIEGESVEFEIIPSKGDHSIGHEIGFHTDNLTSAPPVSDNNPEFITEIKIDLGVNDTIDFIETDSSIPPISTTLSVAIDVGTYKDMDDLALEIKSKLDAASDLGPNNIDYAVSYDSETSRFNIREDGTTLNKLEFLWKTGANSAVSGAGITLGFYPQDDTITYPSSDVTPIRAAITIDDTNRYLDFEEVDGVGTSLELRAVIPGGTYTSIADLETAVADAMTNASAKGVTYGVSYNDVTNLFSIGQAGGPALDELHLLWNSGTDAAESIGSTLGFANTADNSTLLTTSYDGDSEAVLMDFTSENNVINFRETKIDGTLSEEQRIEIPAGSYTGLDDVAGEIQTALRDASPNRVDYAVSYYFTSGSFMIKGSDANIKGFDLLWKTGEDNDSSAAGLLGFDTVQDDSVVFSESDKDIINLVINSTNNKIDFREITKSNQGTVVGSLTASVKQKTYTSYAELGKEVEKALEAESLANGNRIDYSVSWDDHTRRFSIKEKGTELEELQLLWETGDNAPVSEGGSGESIGTILGFEPMDDIETPVKSSREVSWGIFDTLIDLKGYLSDDDPDGIARSLGKLETHYDHTTSRIAKTGIQYNRLEVRQSITSEVKLSLTERRSSIEDADIIESIMNLKAIETAYEASLSSTSKLMNISLVDYL